ncbi:MAG: hypothetical protein AVDCRST_MAG18-464 [uncultured Thermomicrobiales bacterium]|uniref:Uncharacterized protein n=1 Tax=uncultured Thermomicrobiales bacterium TaxID=1645740 RepID=A0A6J4ULZ2_9BACT|nr:MAG: hypothetical protein AVDCRST_MAG18-464 [uncultured Thermomicrobiales bacterium]
MPLRRPPAAGEGTVYPRWRAVNRWLARDRLGHDMSGRPLRLNQAERFQRACCGLATWRQGWRSLRVWGESRARPTPASGYTGPHPDRRWCGGCGSRRSRLSWLLSLSAAAR